MEILRVAPYNLSVAVEVSEPNQSYEYEVEDVVDNSILSGTVTSDSDSSVLISMPNKYDGDYSVRVDGEEVVVTVVRPYVDPNTKGSTASEIAEYARNEQLARAIIDSVITEGFYYSKRVLETTGNGSDYIPLWSDVKKILQVYENNVLAYDASSPDDYERLFEITKDRTAITQSSSELVNRNESAPIILPGGGSDWLDVKYTYRGFPRTYDYKFILEQGYKKIPADIIRATELLIEDISCGKLDYYTRYVADYNTDQFKIKFDSRVFEGTGNILVDKILSKYAKSIKTLGVL